MIKKTIVIMALALTFASCNQQSAADKLNEENLEQVIANQGTPKAVIDNRQHDFGELNLRDKVEHTFIVKNEGTADLVILDAKPSCGCTVLDNYTKTPIKPGDTGIIPVEFSATSAGVQRKTVTLSTNTEQGNEVLTIIANVKS